MGQIRHILVGFMRPQKIIYYIIDMIAPSNTDHQLSSNGRILKILNLSEILVDRLYLPVAVTGDRHCMFGGV